MKILILAPFVYGNAAGHGGAMVSIGQLVSLARSHELHFLSFVTDDDSDCTSRCLDELRSYCASVMLVPLRTGRLKRELCRIQHLFSGMPVSPIESRSKAMNTRIATALEMIRPDVVLIQFPQMAQYVVACGCVPCVMDVQDAQSVSAYRGYRAERSLARKALRLLDWLSWVRYESRFYSLFSRVVTLTDQDRLGLKLFSPVLDVEVVPAAVDFPVAIPERSDARRNSFAFVGSFSHPPNLDGIVFFLEQIFPLVLERRPDAHFYVVGRNAGNLTRYESSNVHFLGFVDDVAEVYRSCVAVVLPLRIGGGIKIKAIEAMAHGCPIVSTAIGIEETGAKDGVHALIADHPGDFAERLVDLLQNQAVQTQLSTSARSLVERKFSEAARTKRLNELLVDAANEVP